MLCNLYGLAFEMVVASPGSGIACDLSGAQTCLLTPSADYWLTAVILLLVLPAVCIALTNWFSGGLRLVKSTAFLGLLLITP